MAQKKDDPHNRAQRAYHKRKTDAGIKRLSVYVPDAGKEDFKKAMVRLNNKWRKQGLIE